MARTTPSSDAPGAALRHAPGPEGLRAVLHDLGALEGVDDAERIDLIRLLEQLKAAAAAAQARIEVAFDASQRGEQAAAGVRAAQQGRGVASQIAAARRESPHRGSRALGFAKALVHEMPHTHALLASGVLSEWRATILVQETACLSVEDREAVDRILCADPARLEGLGTRQIKAEAMKLAYRLDPASVVRRRARAEADRRVSIRPAPDTMVQVTGLVPMVQGVACQAALTKAADALVAAGDPRSRAQIMADTFVERLTGQARASAVAVGVELVMTDRSLLGVDDAPAHVPGQGSLPAWLARRVVAEAADDTSGAVRGWLRRLYADPASGELVGLDSRARHFPDGLSRFIDLRDDGVCRTPWCDAPIRHRDHVVAAESGGPTSAFNGQGLCVQCNHAKQAPGWQARPRPGPRHSVVTITPTGHSYRSTAPPLPGRAVPVRSRLEMYFEELVAS